MTRTQVQEKMNAINRELPRDLCMKNWSTVNIQHNILISSFQTKIAVDITEKPDKELVIRRMIKSMQNRTEELQKLLP